MITLNTNNTIALNKTIDVKYIARLSNFDKKFVFKRDFMNGTSLNTHGDSTVLEVAMKDGKKDYYFVNLDEKTVTKATYEEVKAQAKNKAEFADKYKFGISY